MKAARFGLPVWNLLLGFTLVTVALPTVIAYRGACQPDYEWGLFGWRGVGATGTWWIIASLAACGWLTLGLAHRRPGKWTALMLCLWHGGLFVNVLGHALRHGSAMTLHGDAVGLSLNLAWIGPVFAGLLLLMSGLFLHRFWTADPRVFEPLTRGARGCVGVGLALGPAIATLFLLGDGVNHTTFDRAAILGVILQCLLIGGGLQSRPRLA